jgi:hypothetical protein
MSCFKGKINIYSKISGVENRYLGRLIISRSGFDSHPRNNENLNGLAFGEGFCGGDAVLLRWESKAGALRGPSFYLNVK